jgi:glutathione S-transferase
MHTLFSMPSSGNSYKPRLLLAHLQTPFKHIAMDANDGSTKTSAYQAKNPNGKIPLLQLPDGRYLAESNAILLHLAEGTKFLPKDAYERALCYQWLFFEQYTHEPAIAVRLSNILHAESRPDVSDEDMQSLLEKGNHALSVMETQLSKTPFLTGDTFSVADISLYGYSHSAERAGYDPGGFPNMTEWLNTVSQQPGHVPINWLP